MSKIAVFLGSQSLKALQGKHFFVQQRQNEEKKRDLVLIPLPSPCFNSTIAALTVVARAFFRPGSPQRDRTKAGKPNAIAPPSLIFRYLEGGFPNI